MCGFAGVLTEAQQTRDELEALARELAAPLAHRGPDDEGIWTDPAAGIGMGFRRLSIFDLSPAGHQPMASSTGRFVVAFNGEIYNHPELRNELATRGHAFRSRSDTEVLLEAVEEWGVEEAVVRFRGMFAFGLWDRMERKLWLGRDRVGIKPLFVYQASGRVIFASELKPFLNLPSLDLSLDFGSVAAFLDRLYVPAPRSIFRQVRKVMPGTLLCFDGPTGEPTQRDFWSLAELAIGPRPRVDSDPHEAVEMLGEKLGEAVGIRLRADVPVGAFLSGGIDSSAVVALAQQRTDRPVRTFTITCGSEAHDEGPHARAVADYLGTDHTEVALREAELLDLIPRLPEVFDEPLADPSQLPTYLISRVARDSVTVCLSGDGGDEAFGGYNRYLTGAPLIGRLAGIPKPARTAAQWALGLPGLESLMTSVIRRSGWGANFSSQHSRASRMAKVKRLLSADSPGGMYSTLLGVSPSSPRLVVPEKAPAYSAEAVFAHSNLTLLQKMLLSDQLEYLPDDLLAKVDRASMAVSLEVRVPILDHEVLELAWGFSDDLKTREGRGKWVLRETLYRLLPKKVVDRPKMGFSVPLEAWLEGPLKAWGDDLLSTESLKGVGVVDPQWARNEWESLQSGTSTSPLGVWSLLVLQAWCLRWGISA